LNHQITLYGFGGTRSARCQWTLLELGVDFDFVEKRELIGSDELRKLHPQAKLPALVVDGKALFESVAICNYLCDLFPNNELLSVPGTRARALHEQWCAFTLSEMEAYLWSNAKHQHFYPEPNRVAAIIEPNVAEFRAGARVIEDLLKGQSYLLGETFTLTDIIVGWTLNWARRLALLDDFENIQSYLARLLAREHCCLNKD